MKAKEFDKMMEFNTRDMSPQEELDFYKRLTALIYLFHAAADEAKTYGWAETQAMLAQSLTVLTGLGGSLTASLVPALSRELAKNPKLVRALELLQKGLPS